MTINRQHGIVKYSDPSKGYGFIARADGKSDLFFLHREVLGETPRAPRKGDNVTFDEVKGPRGMQAIQVCNLSDPQSVAAFEGWMTPARSAARQTEQDTRKRYEDYFKRRIAR